MPNGTKAQSYGTNPSGVVMFDANGRMFAMFARPDLPRIASNNPTAATPEEAKAVMTGLIAYFGMYTVDDANKVISLRLDASTFPNQLAGEQKRTITSLTADELKYDTISLNGDKISVGSRRADSANGRLVAEIAPVLVDGGLAVVGSAALPPLPRCGGVLTGAREDLPGRRIHWSQRRTTMKSSSMIATAALLCLAVALSAGHALAQEKQKVSYRVSEQNSKYTQQHVIDVGDVPGHQVRVFEIQRMLPADAPAINGIKLKETWTRGITDYTNYNGPEQQLRHISIRERRQALCPQHDAWSAECGRQARHHHGRADHRWHRKVRRNPG